MNPGDPSVMPAADEREEYLRVFLPKLPAQAEADTRSTLVEEGLSEEQVDVLLSTFAMQENRFFGFSEETIGLRGDPHRWDTWVNSVLRIDVALKSGGRAVLRDRSPYTGYRVEVEWLTVEWEGSRRRNQPKSIHVIADTTLGPVPNLEVYDAAFWVRIRGAEKAEAREFKKAPPLMPESGKAFKKDYYWWLLDQYERLVAQGHRSPAAELARQMDKNPATVRSWLKRARDARRKEEEEES